MDWANNENSYKEYPECTISLKFMGVHIVLGAKERRGNVKFFFNTQNAMNLTDENWQEVHPCTDLHKEATMKASREWIKDLARFEKDKRIAAVPNEG